MKFLFIGDIVGKPGRKAVDHILPELRRKNNYDLVIANAENMTHGKGASEKDVNGMIRTGIDFFTSGNHIWRHRSLVEKMNEPEFPLVRPANYPIGSPGKGYRIIKVGSTNVAIMNLMGRVFMPAHLDCPFRKAEEMIASIEAEDVKIIIVDFHAEATSEKIAFGQFLDGRVSSVLGTHTHVATADYQILPKGTAYITDAGMVGKKYSVIGVDTQCIIRQFLTQLPVVHEITEGPAFLNAVEFEIDEKTGKATSIRQVYEEFDNRA